MSVLYQVEGDLSSLALEKIRDALEVATEASKEDASLTDYRAHKIIEEERQCDECDAFRFHAPIIHKIPPNASLCSKKLFVLTPCQHRT